MKYQIGFESGAQQGTTSRKTLIFAYCFKDLRKQEINWCTDFRIFFKTWISKSFFILKFKKYWN
jgi:hypothetical protein